jgi:hypothetical protein
MRSLTVLASLLLLASAPRALAAPPSVGYAHATDYLDKDSHPERYHPLNLLDGRDATAWCAAEGEGRHPLTIGFKGVATVDEVRIYTGNGTDREAFKAYGRARKITLQGKDGARNFTIEDKRGMQTVPLKPPLTGAWFTLEVGAIFPGSEPGAPVCITDLVFYSEGKPLNGTKLAPVLKYEARTAPLLGTWFAGLEGAPDRFLSFYVDGTYSFVHEPLGGGAGPRTLVGSYTASSSRLTLELPKKGRVPVRFVREEAGGAHGRHTLTLEGDLPEEWKEPFRSRP